MEVVFFYFSYFYIAFAFLNTGEFLHEYFLVKKLSGVQVLNFQIKQDLKRRKTHAGAHGSFIRG